MLSGVNLSDAAAQQRRGSLSWAWFQALFAHLLRPLAKPRRNPECFYKSMRLLAIDGSSWSLANTPQVSARLPLHANQKGVCAAFPKFMTAVLIELGTHQPLGAQCEQAQGKGTTGEITQAKMLLEQLPDAESSLLLADRLYGGGGFIHAVQQASKQQCQVLVRVQDRLIARVLEVLSDGSAVVEVEVWEDPSLPKEQRKSKKLRLREIRARVQRKGQSKSSELRLWTTLLDERKYPAKELAALYAQRWEAELFFRELKVHARRDNLMRAGSLQGAQAEFGALIMAASLLAERRVELAQAEQLPALRLSTTKIGQLMIHAAITLALSSDMLSAAQQRTLIKRFEKLIRYEARIPPRRPRSCPRGLRKTTTDWPRIRQRSEASGTCVVTLKPISFP